MADKPLKWSLFLYFFWGLLSNFGVLFAQNSVKILSKTSLPDAILLKQYDSLTSAYYISAETNKMYVNLHKGLTLAVQNNNERYRGIFLLHKALYLKKMNQLDSVALYAQKAASILQRYKEWKHVSRMLYLLSMIHLDKQDQVGALQNLIALIKFNEKYNEHTNTGSAYHLLARTFHRLNDVVNEKKYILKHLELAEKQHSDYQRLYAFEAWAGFLTDQKQYKTAAIYFAKAYELVRRQNNEDAKAGILITMGANRIAQKEYKKGLADLRLAEQIALKHISEVGWDLTLATDYSYISSLFLSSGEPKKALEYARRSLELVKNKPLLYDYQVQGLKNQAAAQKALGLYQEAFRSYERLQIVTHSLDLTRERETAKEIEARYQFDKSEQEKQLAEKTLQIKELELQNRQKQSKMLWILLGLAISLLCGGYRFYQKNQVHKNQISRKNQQLEALNDTKDKLFGIIGHDLRAPVVDLINTITLLEYTTINAQQLPAFSSSLRKKAVILQTILNNLLYWASSQRQLLRANPRPVSLENTIKEALDLLEGLMQKKSLHIEWVTDSSELIYVDKNHLQIVLYNVIHNAIKFSPNNSKIQIAIAIEQTAVVLRLTNKGEGFEWEGTVEKPASGVSHQGTLGEKGTGLGLLVCAELMKLNQGKIRAFPDSMKGTTLELIFPGNIIANH